MQTGQEMLLMAAIDELSDRQEILERHGLPRAGDTMKLINVLRMVGMSFLLHERVQFAVGQGGFHASAIAGPSRRHDPPHSIIAKGDLSWVYDCGSVPRRHVDAAIDRYIELRSKAPIDFLFLSHFDRDHICGAPRLLDTSKGIEAKAVVIPFLDDTERLIYFARASARPDGKRMERFFQDMTVDPVATLRGLNTDRIIMIGSEDDGEGPIGVDPTDPPSSGDDESGGEGPRWKMVANPADPGAQLGAWQLDPHTTLVRGGAFEMSVDGSAATWQLIPYLRRADPALVAAFRLAAEVLLGWKHGEFVTRMAVPATRRDAVTKHREKMARAYKYAFGDKNVTSMSLYSGPANASHALGYSLCRGGSTHPAKVSWLGTGDADLKDHAEIDAFETHYGGVLDHVTTFMLPHHGSIHNSDPARLVGAPDTWVAAAEPVHGWDHPARQLKRILKERLVQVTSSRKTELVERFLVEWWPRRSM